MSKLKNKKEIASWLQKHNVANYTILDNLKIDVDGNVRLELIQEIPVQFNIVTGDFNLHFPNLNDLEGCPNFVGGNFNAFNAGLKTLIGSPKKVLGTYDIAANSLMSLKNCPQYIGGDFKCFDNRIEFTDVLPKFIKGNLLMQNSRIKHLELTDFAKIELGGMLIISRLTKKESGEYYNPHFKNLSEFYKNDELILNLKQIKSLVLSEQLDKKLTNNNITKKKIKL